MKKRNIYIILNVNDYFNNQKEINEQLLFKFGRRNIHITLLDWIME